MAWTAREDDDKKEYFDSDEELERKATLMAQWIRESKHMIVFTVSSPFSLPRSMCNAFTVNYDLLLITVCREQVSAQQLEVSFMQIVIIIS